MDDRVSLMGLMVLETIGGKYSLFLNGLALPGAAFPLVQAHEDDTPHSRTAGQRSRVGDAVGYPTSHSTIGVTRRGNNSYLMR